MSGRTGHQVLLVSLGSAQPGEALVAGVEQLRSGGATVRLISRIEPSAQLAATLDQRIAVGRPSGRRLVLGKLKADPHRLPGAIRIVLGRRTRQLVRSADALVALDSAALPAAWLAARVNRGAIAVTGLPAALTRLG